MRSRWADFQWRVPVFPPAWLSWRAWHWGASAGDSSTQSWRKRGEPAIPAPENVTRGELQELYDPVWLSLQHHGVTSDTTTYRLAMEITHKLIGIRERQLQRRT
jgi:hypothetical protein